MYLALLGFGMIVVFMALIMAKKLSPFTSLILIPIVFGLLAGYGWDTLEYAANGIISVASTFAMMTFAILYFGVMLTAGMFDPMVDAVVSWCKGDPLKVLVGTSVLAAFVSLDGDGTTTVMICCTAMLPMKRFVKCFFELLTQNLVKVRKCKVQRVCVLHFQLAGSGGCFFLMKLYH